MSIDAERVLDVYIQMMNSSEREPPFGALEVVTMLHVARAPV